ncbi:MAG: membrane protein of unknown function [Promethearchaeota archaeon]|nr:MAG: membrane protein of unknown function [Candidatus Lokiarchaeota archaeon]
MIKALYILRRNGLLLYAKNFTDLKFDENLLYGFFSSVVNFSREGLESVVDFVDLGQENKVIFELNAQENIFTAAIVSVGDNNRLVKKILTNILTGFIDEFSPEYDLNLPKNREIMEGILKENLQWRGGSTLLFRFIISIIVLIGVGAVLTLLNIWVSRDLIFTNIPLYFTPYEFITQTIPILVLALFLELIVVFGLANFISGYILLDLRVSIINAVVYFIIIVLALLLSVQQILIYPIISFLPFVIIASLGGAYLGNELASRKRLK